MNYCWQLATGVRRQEILTRVRMRGRGSPPAGQVLESSRTPFQNRCTYLNVRVRNPARHLCLYSLLGVHSRRLWSPGTLLLLPKLSKGIEVDRSQPLECHSRRRELPGYVLVAHEVFFTGSNTVECRFARMSEQTLIESAGGQFNVYCKIGDLTHVHVTP